MKGRNEMNITVYCGANFGTKSIYKEKTVEVGVWIAKRGDTLVYGGGKKGLMGVIADTVLANNAKVIGITPTFLMERELAHQKLTELIVVDSMTERKLKMKELGDCYIALAGGVGTLEEISELISWSRIGQNDNPCIVFNIDGYYNHLERQYDEMVNKGFLSEEDRSKILFTDSLDEMEKFISEYEPPVFREYN